MSRVRNTSRHGWGRFAAAAAGGLVAVVGVPILLVVCSRLVLGAAHPIPGVGGVDDIRSYFDRGLTATEVTPIAVRVLLGVGWLLWAAMVSSIAAAVAEARSGSRGRWPQFSMFRGLSRWIAGGLTAVSALSAQVAPASAASPALSFTITAAPATAAELAVSPSVARPIPVGHARVLPGESAETFAQRTLGDGQRWSEIWSLNEGRVVGPTGERWTAAWKLNAGWDLALPAGARSVPLNAPDPPGDNGAVPGDEYAVVPGDSYWSIAESTLGPAATDSEVAGATTLLIEVNAPELGYANPKMLHPGDLVDVAPIADQADVLATAPATADSGHVYWVEAGDSYWSIAERRAIELHGADGAHGTVVFDLMNDLIDLNAPRLGYPQREMIQPGDELWLYQPTVALPPPVVSTAAAGPGVDQFVVGAAPAIAPELLVAHTQPLPAPVAPTVTIPPEPPAAAEAPPTTTTTLVAHAGADGDPSDASASDSAEPDGGGGRVLPIGVGETAMLATGLLALIGARRRAWLRAAEPPPRVPLPQASTVATERAVRRVADVERVLRVDVALRSAAASLSNGAAQVTVVRASPDGAIELLLTEPATLPSPWNGAADRWTLAGSVAVDDLAASARTVGAPCVALAPLGVDEQGWDVLVDLEAIGVLAIAPTDDSAAALAECDAVVRGVAIGLACSEFAEVAHLIGVGIDPVVLLDHARAQSVATVDEAMELAATLIGSTAAATRSTFDLRSHLTGGEVWEPAVVLVAAERAAADAGELVDAVESVRRRRGVALLVAESVPDAWTLQVGSDMAVLEPAGIRLHPFGPSPETVDAVTSLVDGYRIDEFDTEAGDSYDEALNQWAPLPEVIVLDPDESSDVDHATSVARRVYHQSEWGEPAVTADDVIDDDRAQLDGSAPVDVAAGPAVVVRLLGTVDALDADGSSVSFEKSKALELLAWMVTHRQHSTRQGARAALWELEVRDATFANVVSDARRALARQVPPPDGDEWVRRTMNEHLVLHDRVVSDAELARRCLAEADGRCPRSAPSQSRPGDDRIADDAEAAASAAELLRPAVEMIRGLPFTASGYLWPDAEGITSGLVVLATTITSRFAELALVNGRLEDVFWATERGLRVIAGQESLIALRMRAHANAGDVSGVRLEWESYVRVLTADPWSDGEPAPKLAMLRRELLTDLGAG